MLDLVLLHELAQKKIEQGVERSVELIGARVYLLCRETGRRSASAAGGSHE
jgi:hypothetical protein